MHFYHLLYILLIQLCQMYEIDRSKVVSLLIGITGIYSIYFYIGILMESTIKVAYKNDVSGQLQKFDFPQSQLLITAISSYLIASVYNYLTYTAQQRNIIPTKHGIKSGLAVTISTIAYSYAIKYTNFPVVMMIRSCNILSVVLVGVLFTGVKDTTVKLGKRKIVVATLATIGMIIFKVFDPNLEQSTQETEIIGIVLMIVSLMSDGFFPDFQAVVKSVYKPHAIVLLGNVNKWAAIICLIFSIATGHLIPMVNFALTHQGLLIDLLLIGSLSFVGQIFIYYLQNIFKQHMVPLIVGTRKIFTVGLSILYFNHKISPMQLIGLVIVLSISLYEFKTESEISKQKKMELQLKEKEDKKQ